MSELLQGSNQVSALSDWVKGQPKSPMLTVLTSSYPTLKRQGEVIKSGQNLISKFLEDLQVFHKPETEPGR